MHRCKQTTNHNLKLKYISLKAHHSRTAYHAAHRISYTLAPIFPAPMSPMKHLRPSPRQQCATLNARPEPASRLHPLPTTFYRDQYRWSVSAPTPSSSPLTMDHQSTGTTAHTGRLLV